MLASVCTPVLAAPSVSDDGIHYTESTIDTSATGSLTIQKLLRGEVVTSQGTGQPEDVSKRVKIGGVKFKIAKIADIADIAETEPISMLSEGSDTTGISGAVFTNVNGVISDAIENHDGTTYTADELMNAVATLGSTAEGNTALTEIDGDEKTTAYDGSTVFSDLPLGLYLVTETDVSDAYVDTNGSGQMDSGEEVTISTHVAPYLVSIPMTNQDELDGHEAGTVWQYDVTSYPKNSVTEADKIIHAEFDGARYEPDVYTADYMIGEDHTYDVYNDIPMLEEGAPEYAEFTISDAANNLAIDLTPGEGKEYYSSPKSIDGFCVGIAGNNGGMFEFGDDYTVTGTPYKDTQRVTDFVVTFTSEGLKKLNQVATLAPEGITILVVYNAYITPESVIGSASNNTNETEFSWVFSNGSEGSVKTNKTQVYTYGIQLLKTGVNNPQTVEFEVRAQSYPRNVHSLSTKKIEMNTSDGFVKEADGIYRAATPDDDETDIVTRISPANDGTLLLKGLDDRYQYIFTEVATDEGANLMSSSFTVTLSGANNNGVLDFAGVSMGESFDVDRATNLKTEDGIAYLEVENTPAPILETGGRGLIAVIAVAGVAGVFAISFYFLNKRAKKEEEEEESSEQE